MSASSAGSVPLIIDPGAVPPTPWRNGAGMTRELWVSTSPDSPASGGPDWRLSLAELTADAPFSPFPGLDRVFLPLAGDLSLTIGDRVVEAVPRQPIRFSGEDAVSAEVRVPGRALNLMVRRGVFSSAISTPAVRASPSAARVRRGHRPLRRLHGRGAPHPRRSGIGTHGAVGGPQRAEAARQVGVAGMTNDAWAHLATPAHHQYGSQTATGIHVEQLAGDPDRGSPTVGQG